MHHRPHCIQLKPFSLYFGWITTAALANLAAWFFALGVYPFALPMDDWAILTVVTATAIYTAVGVRTHDAVYTAVFAWASLGIVLQTLETTHAVRLAAAAGCAVMVVVSVVSIIWRPAMTYARVERGHRADARPGQ